MDGATCTVSAACCTRCLRASTVCRHHSAGAACPPCADPVPSLRTVRRTTPIAVELAIQRALAKAPADRFATAGEFAEALAAPEPHPVRRPAAQTARQRSVTLAAVVLLLLVVLGGSLWLRRAKPIPTLDPKRVAVANFANNSGDTTLATLGGRTADRLASGLTEIQLVQVVDARSEQEEEGQARKGIGADRALAQRLGAGTVLWGSYVAARRQSRDRCAAQRHPDGPGPRPDPGGLGPGGGPIVGHRAAAGSRNGRPGLALQPHN